MLCIPTPQIARYAAPRRRRPEPIRYPGNVESRRDDLYMSCPRCGSLGGIDVMIADHFRVQCCDCDAGYRPGTSLTRDDFPADDADADRLFAMIDFAREMGRQSHRRAAGLLN